MALGWLFGCAATSPPEGAAPDAPAAVEAIVESSQPPVEEDAPTYVFTCADGYEFVAKIGTERAWVFRPGGSVALTREVSGSGVKYGDGSMTLWTKGQEALLEEVGAIHRDCRNDPRRAVWEYAKLRGVDFRAVGNEPAWLLEIVASSKIELQTDYGSKSYEFDLPPAERTEQGATLYRTRQSGHDLSVALRAATCVDSMNGEQFETEVTVVLDDRTLYGCGRPLH